MNEIQSSDQQASGTNSKPIADTCWPNGREAEFHMERWCVTHLISPLGKICTILVLMLMYLLPLTQSTLIPSATEYRRIFRRCAGEGG